ncbi:AAA family ATPase [Paenibacillus sp. FSL E2-8871]|uniref:AAA family ATPase n=1 Tax=Paenibacillus sp. FSL E2-8871 TaxID=2975326 RepID=UPI0030F954C1
MNCFNLASLIQSKRNLRVIAFADTVEHIGLKYKENELECLERLYDNLASVRDLSNFYFGYIIPQIGKEFDLLRFSIEDIINIELKSESSSEEIKEQLRKNRYYLKALDKKIYTYSYILSEDILYCLDDDEEEMRKVEFEELVDLLEAQEIIEKINLDELFLPKNYLVSPFNSTKKFMEKNYFLTDHQLAIKKSILSDFSNSSYCFSGITGEPGTGKTLLTYDIVKELRNTKKVAIIHCAKLNRGQEILKNEYGWKIYSVASIDELFHDNEYEVVVVDEAQRIYTAQLDQLHEYVTNNNIKCLFSYDAKQCFSDFEFNRANPKKIEVEFKAKKYKLTKTIRSNIEIGTFVNNLFNPRQSRLGGEYNSVKVEFFSDSNSVLRYVNELKNRGWRGINYTSSKYNQVTYDSYQTSNNPNAHEVIGQEYDKVVAVIDRNFYYDSQNYLASQRVKGAPGYDLDKMLYQIVTRAKSELLILILNNHDVLKRCLNIFNSK